jgi:hypothetical protein
MVTRRVPPKPKKRAKRVLNPNQELLRDLIAIGKSVPKELRRSMPNDLAAEFDHYHDGTPRQN